MKIEKSLCAFEAVSNHETNFSLTDPLRINGQQLALSRPKRRQSDQALEAVLPSSRPAHSSQMLDEQLPNYCHQP